MSDPVEPRDPAESHDPAELPADPRAVRVGVAPAGRSNEDPTITVGPAPAPAQDAASAAAPVPATDAATAAAGLGDAGNPAGPGLLDGALVDGSPVAVRLVLHDAARARLEPAGAAGSPFEPGEPRKRTAVLFGSTRIDRGRGTVVREVVVDGWRIEVEIEPEVRARLRDRARRSVAGVASGAPIEVRAIIPGRVVQVDVAPGDAVEAGQQILVVEAMKMQNELRAPREGEVQRVGVAVGDTIEVGDLLVVIH